MFKEKDQQPFLPIFDRYIKKIDHARIRSSATDVVAGISTMIISGIIIGTASAIDVYYFIVGSLEKPFPEDAKNPMMFGITIATFIGLVAATYFENLRQKLTNRKRGRTSF